MRQKVLYLYMEIKKTLRMFPRMLLQAILLMFLIGMIAFCGAASMHQDPLAASVDIAVVVREDNMMTRMALNYVENMESVAQLCRFRQMSEEEGFGLLQRGEAAALILLPEQLVEGIMNGTNPTVEIYFPKNAGLEALLFRELTESGAGLLRVAQAQIYGVYDTAAEFEMMEQLSQMEAEIDSYNLAFALDRLALYDTENVSVFGSMNAVQFYMASGFILFLLLAGMALYPVVQREPQVFRRQLERNGTGLAWQCFCQWSCGALCMGLLCGILWIVAKLVMILMPEEAVAQLAAGSGSRYPAGIGIGIMALTVVTITTLIYLLYSLAGSRTSGILLVFLFSVGMVYLSGGLVPAMFMPEPMQRIGARLPTAYLIQACGGFLAGRGTAVAGQYVQCTVALCGYTAVAGIAAYLLQRRGK